MNREDAVLVARQQIIDKIANDGVGLVAELRHNAADESAAARMPFQIDRAMEVSRAVDLRPAMWPARLLRPDFDEAEFSLQLRVAHDFIAQRSATSRDDLNYSLHLLLGSTAINPFAMLV
jgi:hypothetical protein